MPVRKLQSYEVDYQEELHQQVPRYQDYIPEAQSDTNLKEILFFVNIAIFCICIAIFSFIFLALKFSTALAFVAAIGSSLLVLKIQRSIIKRNAFGFRNFENFKKRIFMALNIKKERTKSVLSRA